MARYRLRFLLQEFDLPPGETMIGRGPDCRITIIDPLVSRHHARVVIDGERATVEDLGSRNGSRVNGRTLRGKHVLHDGDRIRIGTQDLVFSQIEAVPLATNKQPTGFLCHCAKCHMPFPEEMGTCPSCGSSELAEESTLSGILDDRGRQNWALQMLLEMLEKAVSLGRGADAERILNQAIMNVEERLKGAGPLDLEQIEALGSAAVRLSQLQGTGKWAKWTLDLHRRVARLPSRSLVDLLGKLPRSELETLTYPIDVLIGGSPLNKLSPAEHDGLNCLKALRAGLRGG